MNGVARDSGFTLVEVLIALAIAASVSSGVAVLVSTAALHAHHSRARTVAAMLAVQKMEQLVPQLQRGATPSAGGSTDAAVPGFFDLPDPSGIRPTAPDAGPARYVRMWSLSTLSDGTCLVRVSVSMPHMPLVSSARITTIACRGGL